MCGLVSCLSLHPSNPASCLQQQPTPSASEAHISCLEAEKQIPFYLPCKSTDVWNVSKCTQPSLGFRHSFSLDDLLGIFITIAFQADKLSFCSFAQELPPPQSFNSCVMGNTFVQPHLPCPGTEAICKADININQHLKNFMLWHADAWFILGFIHISPVSCEERREPMKSKDTWCWS